MYNTQFKQSQHCKLHEGLYSETELDLLNFSLIHWQVKFYFT